MPRFNQRCQLDVCVLCGFKDTSRGDVQQAHIAGDDIANIKIRFGEGQPSDVIRNLNLCALANVNTPRSIQVSSNPTRHHAYAPSFQYFVKIRTPWPEALLPGACSLCFYDRINEHQRLAALQHVLVDRIHRVWFQANRMDQHQYIDFFRDFPDLGRQWHNPEELHDPLDHWPALCRAKFWHVTAGNRHSTQKSDGLLRRIE